MVETVDRLVTDRAVRVGVVGAGSWAALAHIPAVLKNPHAELVGLADRDPERLRATADHYGIDARFTDHRELLAAGLDALVIATPHTTHHPIACDAIEAGVHLLVEKPLTVDARDAHDLDARARSAGLHLVVGYTFNFAPGGMAARACMQSGTLGEITLLSAVFSSDMLSYYQGEPRDESAYVLAGPSADTYADPAQSGGGQGHAQVTHALGMLLWVTGLRPRRVTAFMSNLSAPVDVVDAIACQFEGGALGTIASTGAVQPGPAEQQVLHYFGTRGAMTQDLPGGRVMLYPVDQPPRELAPASSDELDIYPHGAPVRCLIDLVRGASDENPSPASSAVATVELLDAAYRSATDGGRPVDVAQA